MAKKVTLLAIVGTTASGKTGLSIALAKKYNGEIIAADSRTIYKFLDIGTAKPNREEQKGIRHWGLDIVGPGDTYSAAQFQQYAKRAIMDIAARGKLPIVVGGSGLYIDAILYDYTFAEPNKSYREELSSMTVPSLQQLIRDKKLDMPENDQNKRYLIRALERGTTIPAKTALLSGACVLGLNPPKHVLEDRITRRAQQMIDSGVIDEIQQAYEQYPESSEALQGGIYKSFWPFMHGTMSKADAVKQFVASDMRLAKKQRTWFMRNKDITWFDEASDAEAWFNGQYGGTL